MPNNERERLLEELFGKMGTFISEEDLEEVADFILKHTEELRKENAELKANIKNSDSLVADLQFSNKLYREKNAKLKALVDEVEKLLTEYRISQFGIGEPKADEALAKIAEFKKGSV